MPMVRLPLTTEHALLGFLRERPMHGYEIFQRLTDSVGLGQVWRLKQSQLYALLAKLEEAGLIAATVEPQEPRPPRRVFHLTDAGHAAFAQWVGEAVPRGRDLRLEFLAKLFFAEREGPEIAAALVARQRAACGAWLREQRQRADRLRDAQPYDWLVHQFRIGQLEAMLAWLDQCEQALLAAPALP